MNQIQKFLPDKIPLTLLAETITWLVRGEVEWTIRNQYQTMSDGEYMGYKRFVVYDERMGMRIYRELTFSDKEIISQLVFDAMKNWKSMRIDEYDVSCDWNEVNTDSDLLRRRALCKLLHDQERVHELQSILQEKHGIFMEILFTKKQLRWSQGIWNVQFSYLTQNPPANR